MTVTSIVWLRRDLRVNDNPALNAAAARGAVVPVYVYAPEEEQPWAAGAASRAWLHRSLTAVAGRLKDLGAPLNFFRGDSVDILEKVAAATGADAIYYNRRYEPEGFSNDARIESALMTKGLRVRSFKSGLIFEPDEIEKRSGGPFRVFTPFYRHCLSRLPAAEAERPPLKLRPPGKAAAASLEVGALGLLPAHPWADTMLAGWSPGEHGAARELEVFLESTLDRYPQDRDIPGVRGVSRLSPHLHHGEVSPRTVVTAVRNVEKSGGASQRRGAQAFLRQIIWREFAAHLLFHFPSLTDRPFDKRFENFPWRTDASGYAAWTRGLTGYPMVDAGMRELWATGWMHNRVRMVVASFLTKHLLMHWRQGARWFWDTLVDADLANNTLGWQWTAGCGVDPAPYFRVFNPVAQGERFDPTGNYVRRWIPELARLADRFVHRPFEAGAGVLAEAGIRLGEDYPEPRVGHKAARERALAAFDRIRGG
ncbi:MAG TPA: deoxyribodipyrimidine photo-lyase [Gammaproteobacteria bacterium]|nr:deoxyribodipyrimidine photo-lyase [Gammaproteobacteria bacterium]